MINKGFFQQPQSLAAQWPRTSKMHQICGAPNFIQIKIPFKDVLYGCKINLKSSGNWQGWSICTNNNKILKKMTNPTGPRAFFKRFYTDQLKFKRIFSSDEIWSSTDWMHFRGLRPLCSSRLRQQEKSLVYQLPLDQNLLKPVLGWTTFLN